MDRRINEDQAPDAVLIGRVQRGQIEAFNQLVLRHQATAYNVAYRVLGDSGAAADATQDSFVKAYQRCRQYRGDEGSFKGWLLRIVVNTCYDVLRRERRSGPQGVALDAEEDAAEWHSALRDPAERPEEHVLRNELAARLEAAIMRLPADQRIVLVLSDVEGYQYGEIAGLVGVPIGTVKSRLARARARVRDVIRYEDQVLSRPSPPGRPRGERRPAEWSPAGSRIE